MKMLVTGAAGFIGSTLSASLVSDGHDVVGVDALTDYYDVDLKRRNVQALEGPHFQFVAGDLTTLDLVELLAGVEIVFHQAGQPGVRSSWGEEFGIYTAANIEATQKLLEAARGSASLRKFVYASSSSVYGNAERYPTRESDRPTPLSPYGVSKLAAEHLCVLYAQNFGVPTVSLRYFTVYGPKQRPDMAFTRFTQAALLGTEINLFGDGNQTRDFTYVDDIVAANVLAGLGESKPGAVYNVAGGSNVSMNDVIDLLRSMVGAELRVVRHPVVVGDVRRTRGATNLIHDELGWAPQISLEEGLSRHLAWSKVAVERRGRE